jgi:hypothetical protein
MSIEIVVLLQAQRRNAFDPFTSFTQASSIITREQCHKTYTIGLLHKAKPIRVIFNLLYAHAFYFLLKENRASTAKSVAARDK